MVILLWHTRWSAGTWPPCPGWWSPPLCLKSSPMPACFFQGVGLLAGVCRYLEYFFASSWTLYVTLGFIKTHFLGRGSNASINFTFFSVYTSLAKRPCWFYLATQIKPVYPIRDIMKDLAIHPFHRVILITVCAEKFYSMTARHSEVGWETCCRHRHGSCDQSPSAGMASPPTPTRGTARGPTASWVLEHLRWRSDNTPEEVYSMFGMNMISRWSRWQKLHRKNV